MPKCVRAAMLAAVSMLINACTVGPDYKRPTIDTPAGYKEMDGWTVAHPQDTAVRGKWWEIYNDPELNALQDQVSLSNQNLAAAEAQYRQARALVQVARSAFFPVVSAGVSASRSQSPSTLGSSSTTTASRGPANTYTASLDAAWEADVWGRVARSVEGSRASAQASAADIETLRLSVQGQLAVNYFQLRALDAQRQLLDATIAAYGKSLDLTKNRYAGGVASKTDVAQADTQLKSTQAQALDTGVQRAQLEHAIALLVGKPASTFSIPVAPLAAVPPAVPVGVPSEVLERRPDIAAAERRVAAANAQIGVAQAAFYPSLTLSASGGFESANFSRWLTLPSRFWALGPALAQTLFDGGLRRAQTEQARAAYDATVAAYRQTVLAGFQEVEDNLAALRILEQESRVQDEALRSARESMGLALNQYKAGTIDYLSVVIVQAALLTNERNAVDILNRRMAASVQLVKALGGGWDLAALPGSKEVSDNGSRSPAK